MLPQWELGSITHLIFIFFLIHYFATMGVGYYYYPVSPQCCESWKYLQPHSPEVFFFLAEVFYLQKSFISHYILIN